MKKQLLGLMTILTVIGACQKNEVASISESATIHATIEDKDATRTVMDENNNKIYVFHFLYFYNHLFQKKILLHH